MDHNTSKALEFDGGPMAADWIDVAAVTEIEPGHCVVVDIEGIRVAVFHVGGEYIAVLDQWSPQTHPALEGDREGATVICTMDGARFSFTSGEVRYASRSDPAAGFSVRVRNGVVQVRPGRWGWTATRRAS